MARLRKGWVALCAFLLFTLPLPIQAAQHFWYKLILGEEPPETGRAFANVLTTLGETLRKWMPDADTIDEELKTLDRAALQTLSEETGLSLDKQSELTYKFYIARKSGKPAAYAVEDAVQGKWGLIHYVVLISPEGAIQDIEVTAYEEKRGKPVAKNRFLKQFRNKTVRDDIKLMKDIQGVTGASISSAGMTNGIRKLIHVFNYFYGK